MTPVIMVMVLLYILFKFKMFQAFNKYFRVRVISSIIGRLSQNELLNLKKSPGFLPVRKWISCRPDLAPHSGLIQPRSI